MIAQCSNCKHAIANPQGSEKTRMCTRFPPIPYITNLTRDPSTGHILATEQLSIFPIVAEATHCAEHTAAGALDAPAEGNA